MKSYRHKYGFTLTELLIVIAIVIALAALSFPLIRSGIAKAQQVACLGNLRNIGIGIESYLQDHQDKMPVMQAGRSSKNEDVPVLDTVLAEYLTNPEVFHCPADKVNFKKSGNSYLWNSTQNGRHKSQLAFFGIDDNPSAVPLVTDKESVHTGKQGVNILYADYTASKELRFSTSQ